MTRHAFFIAVALAVVTSMSLFGCGKKDWPEPDLDAERFEWASAGAELRRTCLVVTGELTGNIDNLDAVYVELDRGECRGCPFRPDKRMGYELPSPMVQRSGNTITVNVCGLDGSITWRWRLIGKNVYDVLGEAASETGSVSPGQ
jgi:hypothetical protein